MPFYHPYIFLAGLGAASIPVIIHLLNRRRFRVLDWAAMKFLLESIRQNRRRLRIEELILLAIRCLIILLLGLALARFTGCAITEAFDAGTDSSATVVFVLDDSFSMAQKHGAGTLFSEAKQALIAELERVPSDHRFAILLTSQSGRDKAFADVNLVEPRERGELTDKLSARRPSDRRTSLADAMETAREMLVGPEAAPGPKRVVVLSDFRRVDLADKDVARRLGGKFEALQKLGAEVTVVDFGRDASSNLTVQSVRLLDRFSVAGSAARVEVKIRNNGPRTVEQVNPAVRFRHGGQDDWVVQPVPPIKMIAPGVTHTMQIKVTPKRSGSALLEVALPADELAGDNVARLVLDVRGAIKALLVDGHIDMADREDSESHYLRWILDPDHDAAFGVKVDVFGSHQLSDLRFDEYDVVMLLNVSEFPLAEAGAGGSRYPQLKALERYVRGGGGLVIFTGDNISTAFYNGPLHADGLGLSPLRLGPPATRRDARDIRAYQDDPATAGRPFIYRLDIEKIEGVPYLEFFAGPDKALAGMIRFFEFHTTDESIGRTTPDLGKPHVVARFADKANSPAIVSRTFGEGQVVMFYTSASSRYVQGLRGAEAMRWHDWALPEDNEQAYMDVMMRLTETVARAGVSDYTGRVGEPVLFELSGELRDFQGELRTEDADEPEQWSASYHKFDTLAARVRAAADVLRRTNAPLARDIDKPLDQARQACRDQDASALQAQLESLSMHFEAAGDAGSEMHAELESAIEGPWRDLLIREFRVAVPDAGIYAIDMDEGPGVRKVYFVRNTDPTEGRLDRAGRERIVAVVGSEESFAYTDYFADRLDGDSGLSARGRPDKEYWRWAMVAMIGLLALETFLAQRFGHYSS